MLYYTESLCRTVFSAIREREWHAAVKISYFGDTRSHTFAAVSFLLGEEGAKGYETDGCETVYEALRRVRDGESDAAAVPIENSFEGTVTATEDALGDLRLYIVREIVLPVRQNLIVKNGVTLKDIRRVYSHPQALAQCRATLRSLLPQAVTEQVAYTSAGLDKLDDDSAAIARAPQDGQTILKADITDSPDNCTRFVLVKAAPARTGNKFSVRFSAANRPGALVEVLNELYARGLNMVKIESRPAKKRMGQYVFYVDFLLTEAYKPDAVLSAIAEKAEDLRFLGRYEPGGMV